MIPMKKWIAMAVLCALSTGILFGFSHYEAVALAAKNKEAIENAIVGANTVVLSVGAFQSEAGLTGGLSADELRAQMERYEESVQAYFSPEYPGYQAYIDLNAYYLSEVYAETVDYQVSGGVEDSRLVSVTYASHEREASALAYLQVYKISVVGNGDGSYSVACSVNLVKAAADLQKTEGEWRVTAMELNLVEEWCPESEINGPEGAVSPRTSYSSFQAAREAAAQSSIQDCCPVSICDLIT